MIWAFTAVRIELRSFCCISYHASLTPHVCKDFVSVVLHCCYVDYASDCHRGNEYLGGNSAIEPGFRMIIIS